MTGPSNGEKILLREENRWLVWVVRLLVPAMTVAGWSSVNHRLDDADMERKEMARLISDVRIEAAATKGEQAITNRLITEWINAGDGRRK